MDNQPRVIVSGFPEMWQPVYQKYKALFELADEAQVLVNEMTDRPLNGQLAQSSVG